MGKEEDDRFVKQYRPFVMSIANRVMGQFDLKCEIEDLAGFGFAGLLEARTRFDPSRGVQFNTFSYYRVRGAILDGVRQMAYLPPRAHALRRAAEGADKVLEDAAHARGAADPGQVKEARDTVAALDSLLGKMSASFVMASLGHGEDDGSATPEEELLEGAEAGRIRSAVAKLPERERSLVVGFYFEGRRFDHVADDLGISKSWASRLHSKALGLLREALEEG